MIPSNRRRMAAFVFCLAASSGFAISGIAYAQSYPHYAGVALPLTTGWFAGEPALYTTLDASDPGIAKALHANYSSAMGNAANTAAVDDIYLITNFKQGNILASHPRPAGFRNRDPNYTPFWQASLITWNSGTTPYVLTSEAAVLDVVNKGFATRNKTNILINCTVIYTPSGGQIPKSQLLLSSP
jgi:hypothetical protein